MHAIPTPILLQNFLHCIYLLHFQLFMPLQNFSSLSIYILRFKLFMLLLNFSFLSIYTLLNFHAASKLFHRFPLTFSTSNLSCCFKTFPPFPFTFSTSKFSCRFKTFPRFPSGCLTCFNLTYILPKYVITTLFDLLMTSSIDTHGENQGCHMTPSNYHEFWAPPCISKSHYHMRPYYYHPNSSHHHMRPYETLI